MKQFLRDYLRYLRNEAFNPDVLAARMNRWAYLVTEGLYRGECSYEIRDSRGLRLLGSGVPVTDGVYQNWRVWWERPEQRVRWIETRGCMAEQVHHVRTGVVIREYTKDTLINPYECEPVLMLEIRFENGDALHFPKRAFMRAPDGVLEYRY